MKLINLNGTYTGVYSPEYRQDYFLGVPYAQPPIGDLRFRNPKALNASWTDSRKSTKFSAACVGYGVGNLSLTILFEGKRFQPSRNGYETSEDCLYLNIVRPSGAQVKKHDGLPVAVWIHGGGFVQGSGVDRRYNLSFIVQDLWPKERQLLGHGGSDNDGTNYGLRDQRLALHWIKENIVAFGGDSNKIKIWGQSAGAGSVGLHITAYGGRDDGLFRSAIMQSGAPIFFGDQHRTSYFQGAFRNLTVRTACNITSNSLACLRALPFGDLNAVLNTTAFSSIWQPQIEGDIIERRSSEQLDAGDFVHVPIVIGANSDEGTSFSPQGINSTAIFDRNIRTSAPLMNSSFAEQILTLYPDDPSQEILANLGLSFRPGPPQGSQYRRAATYYGDTSMIANRRLACETWAWFNLTAYCYRFNAIPTWASQLDGATHFAEVAFTMLTLSGVGYPPVIVNPFEGKPQSFTDLARLMSSDWIHFVATGKVAWKGRDVPAWPKYKIGEERQFVYDANRTSFVEEDTYRKEGIALINEAALTVYGR